MASPAGQTVLVLSPHPDDETFGCGGTIKLLTTGGTAVDVLYLTRGEMGVETPETATAESQRELALVREQEARAACAILGVREVRFLEGRDSQLASQPGLVEPLCQALMAGRYDRVFCPWPEDGHVDHQATFAHFRQALRRYREPLQVWLYEVWTPLRHTICVPIDTTMEAKVAAMRAHRSQLACLNYLTAFQGLAAYRGLFCPGSRFAEAFITGDRQMVSGDA
jgi:LmbE family N-acetylglucosaminyl deacetylase